MFIFMIGNTSVNETKFKSQSNCQSKVSFSLPKYDRELFQRTEKCANCVKRTKPAKLVQKKEYSLISTYILLPEMPYLDRLELESYTFLPSTNLWL